uniref:NFAM1 Ig-like domain-containing protein n=1 Tax=Varanus komodoensis TaxID=61221 RepID=A0A8D2LQ04_VARKO
MYLVGIMLAAGRKRGIKEESLIQIAFANEQVNASCKATFPYTKEYTHFKVSYYRIDSKGEEITMIKRDISETIPQGMMNQTTRKIYKLPIQPDKHNSVTGTYYCKAEWQNSEASNGNGTFILFRGKSLRASQGFVQQW